jgi:hypothetical protein
LNRLERLPTELVEMLLDVLVLDAGEGMRSNTKTVLALALSSSILYPIVLRHIHREYTRTRLSWAGKAVGFFGAESYFSPEQLAGWNPRDVLPWNESGSGEKWWVGYESVRGTGEEVWCEAVEGVKGGWEGVEWEDVKRDLSQAYLYEEKGKGDGGTGMWVLRNLNTREVVRSDKLVPSSNIVEDGSVAREKEKGKVRRVGLWKRFREKFKRTRSGEDDDKEKKEEEQTKYLAPLTLPQIFLILTAHTSVLHWFDENIGFTPGPWVNHAFELVTLGEHVAQSNTVGVNWEDVSTEVANDVGHLRWCVMRIEELVEQLSTGVGRTEFREFLERMGEGRRVWMGWRGDKGVALDMLR